MALKYGSKESKNKKNNKQYIEVILSDVERLDKRLLRSVLENERRELRELERDIREYGMELAITKIITNK